MKKVILFLISFLTVLFLTAQQKTIDSLQQDLSKSIDNGNKVDLLNTLSKKYQQNNNYTYAITYATIALNLANKINYKAGIANSFENIGNNFNELNNYPEGLKNNLEALHAREELMHGISKESDSGRRIEKDIAGSYGNIGISYAMQGKYDNALKNYYASLKIYEELFLGSKDSNSLKELKIWRGNTQNMIGIIHFNMGDHAEALKNYIASLKIFFGIGDKQRSSACYNNIANIYALQKNYTDALANYNFSLQLKKELNDTLNDNYSNTISNVGKIYFEEAKLKSNSDSAKSELAKAMRYYLSSLIINKKIKNPQGIAIDYNNIGATYAMQENNQVAIGYFSSALKIFKETNNNLGIANSSYFIGESERKLGKYSMAKENLEKALELSGGTGDKDIVKDIYLSMAQADSANRNFKTAFEYYKMYTLYKDSIYNEASNFQITEMKTKYESEKKDQENLTLKLDNQAKEIDIRWQRILKFVFLGGMLVLIIIAFLVIKRNQAKSKANNLVQQNKFLKQQEDIKQRISNDLHDEIGSGLTQITMICNQGESKVKKHTPIESSIFDKISAKSQQLSENLSDLIWATNPQNANLSNLILKIRTYAYEFINGTVINLALNLPDNSLSFETNPETNKNIFLIVKEGLHNIVKHSCAQKLEIDFLVDNDKNFTLAIRDNGKGFDTNIPSSKNGRKSLEKRVASIKNGEFILKSIIGQGTTVTVNGSLV